MKPLVTYPDVEEWVVAQLKLPEFEDQLEPYTKSVGLPRLWKPDTHPIHLQVACDAEFLDAHPIAARSTVRVVAWGDSPTVVKRAAHLAQACLLSIGQITPLTGVLPATDDETHAELAMFTVRIWTRSTPI